MSRAQRRYVVVKEGDFDWCRLRLANAPGIVGLDVLWEGDSLRAGYDVMIRINRGRRPVVLYSIARRGRALRLFKGPPDEGWQVVKQSTSYAEVRMALSEAVRRRDAEERERRLLLIAELRELGVKAGSKMPSLTDADRRYLEWRRVNRKARRAGVLRVASLQNKENCPPALGGKDSSSH